MPLHFVTNAVNENPKRTAVAWLCVSYLVLVGALALLALGYESILDTSGAPPTIVDALFGRDELARVVSGREDDAQRSAATTRAVLAGATAAFGLSLLILLGPRPLRLSAALLLVGCVSLLTLELSAGVLGVHFPGVPRADDNNRNLSIYDSTKGWFHVPGGAGFVPIEGGPDKASVRINSQGLRGSEVSIQKPPDVTRILVLGDSFGFGVGVDEEHLFTTHLERVLDEREDPIDYEVVNMGVIGYATDQELILFQETGMRLAPDLVILLVCDNDFQANTESFVYRRYYKPYYDLNDRGELVAYNQPVPRLDRWQRVKLYLGQSSILWNFFRSRPATTNGGGFSSFFQVGLTRQATTDPVRLAAALIRELHDRVDASGARFLVVNTGHRGERTPLFHALRPMLEPIPQLGLEGFLGKVRDDAPERLWDFPEDTHWNRDAHQFAAEIIAGHLIRHGLLH